MNIVRCQLFTVLFFILFLNISFEALAQQKPTNPSYQSSFSLLGQGNSFDDSFLNPKIHSLSYFQNSYGFMKMDPWSPYWPNALDTKIPKSLMMGSQNKTSHDRLLVTQLNQQNQNSPGFFETIFGGNEIEFQINGTVGGGLEAIYQQIDMPQSNQAAQNNLDIGFDQFINVSLNGRIGKNIDLIANYDSQSTFRFQNDIKIRYKGSDLSMINPMEVLNNPNFIPFPSGQETQRDIYGALGSIEEELFSDHPYKDNIIQNVELGSIRMPIKSHLIDGVEDLFGLRTDLKFGKTHITAVVSRQRSENQTIKSDTDGRIQTVELSAYDYQSDQHYFLAHFFRDHYQEWLSNYPHILSTINISRIEVWVTNQQYETQNIRNIVAIADLGESSSDKTTLDAHASNYFNTSEANSPAANQNNILDVTRESPNSVLNKNIYDISSIHQGFGSLSPHVQEGIDYELIQNAVLLSEDQYTFNSQLGYISLNTPLQEDQVLAVAFQYSYRGEIYQVGEFSDSNNFLSDDESQVLIVKLLKNTLRQSDLPLWDLMMKNIYSTGAFGIDENGFGMNIYYNNPKEGTYLVADDPNIWPKDLVDRSLLNLFKLDQLNTYQDRVEFGDGFFDFIPGITINPSRGIIIFPVVEPFGEYLFEKLSSSKTENYDAVNTYNPNQKKYVYYQLYQKTRDLVQQDGDKNSFLFQIQLKSQHDSGISLGTVNIPRGSVRVRYSGRLLQEGVDYSVNYQAGMVRIINPTILSSGLPIDITLENNTLFNKQAKRFLGLRVDHRINNHLQINGTYLKLSEKPFSQKAIYGQEPVNNQIVGFGFHYQQPLSFMDRWISKLPGVPDAESTPSFVTINGEVAQLALRNPKETNINGRAVTYIDDFETSGIKTSLKNPSDWVLASVPLHGVAGSNQNGLESGFGRSKMAWYTIDPIFYNQNFNGMDPRELSSNQTRQIFIEELFPQRDITKGTSTIQTTFDLAYYPDEKGPYNNASDGIFQQSKKGNWAGVMREISSPNFSLSNVQYIEFWLLDTFSSQVGESDDLGELIFHLGNISEDILKDNQKQYENGLAREDGGSESNTSTVWGNVPNKNALFYSFNESDESLAYQDLGLDGLSNSQESFVYSNGNPSDPAGDDYQFYLNAQGNILDRYKNYNGTQNNSFSSATNTNRPATRLPDVEDIDRDQNMNTSERYFQYRIPISRNMNPKNHPYIVQVRHSSRNLSTHGNQFEARWLLFRIPIDPNFGQTPQNNPLIKSIGEINSFQSLRYMRMLLKGFENPTVFRFGTLDLVMGNWRASNQRLNGTMINSMSQVEVGLVNIVEHENRLPINYQLPINIQREEFIQGNDVVRSNEQSLTMKVIDLEPEESKGVFNAFDLDLTVYQRLIMDLHAESLEGKPQLSGDPSPSNYDVDNSLVVFVRLGNDQHENYYQIEMPIRPTPIKEGETRPYTAQEIWMPEINQLDVSIDFLMQLKAKVFPILSRASPIFFDADLKMIDSKQPFSSLSGPKKYRYSIRGFPALNQITSIVLGVKNSNQQLGQKISGEIWFNELRLEGINQRGGTAFSGNMELNLSDFANIIASIKDNTSGFGPLNRTPRQISNQSTLEYNISGSVNLNYLLPKKWGLHLPLTFVKQQLTNTPDYDPIFRDLLLENRLDHPSNTASRQYLLKQFQESTRTQSISLLGTKQTNASTDDVKFYSLENFNLSLSYHSYDYRSYQLEYQNQEDLYFSLAYRHDIQQKPIFLIQTKNKINQPINSSLIQMNLLPSSIHWSLNIDRSLSSQRYRDLSILNSDSSQASLFPELFDADYQLNYQYGFDYPLFNALNLKFTANTSTILRDQTNGQKLKIYSQFFEFGQPDQHYHTIHLNYRIPFERFSWFDFIESTFNYSGNYSWKRGASIISPIQTGSNQESQFINIIQNDNSQSLMTRIDLNRIKTLLGIEPQQSNTNSRIGGIEGILSKIFAFHGLQFQYSENHGIYLPGYLPQTGFVGITKPGLFWFSLGGQSDIRFEAAKKGWLTEFPEISLNYEQNHRSTFDFSTDFNPYPFIAIRLSASRSYSSRILEDYNVERGNYLPSFSNRMGSFEISRIFLKSTFRKLKTLPDLQVQKFKNSQTTIAKNLVQYYQLDQTTGENGFPKGFHRNHRDLLLYGFMEEFGQFDTKKRAYDFIATIPLPNWTVQIDLIKDNPSKSTLIQRLFVTNSYRGSYTINHFQTNIEYDKDNPFELDQNGYYKPQWIVSNANVVEQFNPLIAVDVELKNTTNFSFSINRDRATSFSFSNQLLTQSASYEYHFQTDFQIRTQTASPSNPDLKKLDAQVNFIYRDHTTIIRNLLNDTNQIINGQQTFNLQLSAQYRFSTRLVGRLFYNHDFTKQKVSFGFDQNIIRSGFSIRYDFNP
ncbi:MAG: cell surface protein SprA [Flavobacteriaceae bacterium]|nr:cell surface protein SprA [Flavobacteriaceae bacterium]MCY4267065.1 cell surface protein SprA [Flavobacteriaceae bacterium]